MLQLPVPAAECKIPEPSATEPPFACAEDMPLHGLLGWGGVLYSPLSMLRNCQAGLSTLCRPSSLERPWTMCCCSGRAATQVHACTF